MQPMQPGDVPRTFADIAETTRDLGWRPTTSVEEGFPRFVQWYKEYHGLG
jgi:UDP-glucuronate 4-epimerase